MQLQIALWIFFMGISFSLNKDPKRQCYQAENVSTESENNGKIRGKRSLPRYGQASKPKQSRVCSTWGNFQFRTFDGEIFRFPGICNYLLASHCREHNEGLGNYEGLKHYEDFNIQIDQSWDASLPTVSQLSVTINELLIEVINKKPSINGENILLPYNNNGIWIDIVNNVLKIIVKSMLELTWEDSNFIHLTLNKKYMGETCGLCGNYNGNRSDDLVYGGNAIDPLLFGKLYKLRKPGQKCKDPKPEQIKHCKVYRATCLKHLKNYKWMKCNKLVPTEPYVEAYMLDMCLCNATAKYRSFCLCSTITEYSHQCALAGGSPPNWRSSSMCYKPCRPNLIYKECSPPCTSTCSNPGLKYFCDGPCVAGCVCPEGLVLDDITNLGCIPIAKCSCTYDKDIYPPGSVYNSTCSTCLCSGGHWNCKEVPCPSTCSVEGGSHITTFDNTRYIFHGKCVYVLAKPCANSTFSVNIEMKKCAYSASGTCLTKVFLFLDEGAYEFEITYDNYDFPYVNFDKTKMAKAGVSIFWPSSFYLIVYTNKGLYLVVQLTPIMQLYVVLAPSYKEQMCGLCGDFNSIQKDDFRTSSGAIETNVVDFVNTWKARFRCKPIKPIHEHPCIYGMEVEKYANYWCNVLLDTVGPFAPCHSSVSPEAYQQNCLFDTCACKRAEDCLCAALSSYVWACAAAGITLPGWRENICRNFIYHCPPSFVYSYIVTTCIPTCRSLFEPDPVCKFKFHTVDGCVCPKGTYLDDRGVCVNREDCPCYYKGIPVYINEPLSVGRLICTCTNGTLHCTDTGIKECPYPMVYFDCEEAGETAKGTECSRSCSTLTIQCYSSLCVSGCICPKGLVLNGSKTCIIEEECPCVHNETNYNQGEVATIHCNQCVCRNRTWVCNNKTEMGICTLYGDGHYITFDNKRYTINGDCEYTLAQDYCDINQLWNGTFKVISENIPCGTTGTSCSKSITLYLGAHKLILEDGGLEVLKRSNDVNIPYKIRSMGLFIIIETKIGLVLVWDRRTTIYIYLSTNFKGKVCGLCGNFDGNGNNDFTTRSQCVVEDVKLFRDSWKVDVCCPEVYISRDPCVVHPYKVAWAQKLCNLILSHVFVSCHSEVNPEKYFDDCIKDTCACDMGGDCDCYCSAVAAYAQACSDACVCIDWRSPTLCPLDCDFYTQNNQCYWRYMPCGGHCMKTCRNPKGLCISDLKGLEGCYPKCPEDKPYFNEDEMQCVSQCGCLDQEDNYYVLGETVESCNVCEICNCTTKGLVCHYDLNACNCEYEGQMMQIGEIIQVVDSFDDCTEVYCGLNGTIKTPCYTTTDVNTGTSTTLGITKMSTESLQSTILSSKMTTYTSLETTTSSRTTPPTTTSTKQPETSTITSKVTTVTSTTKGEETSTTHPTVLSTERKISTSLGITTSSAAAAVASSVSTSHFTTPTQSSRLSTRRTAETFTTTPPFSSLSSTPESIPTQPTEHDIPLTNTTTPNFSLVTVSVATSKKVVVHPLHYTKCNFTCTDNETIVMTQLDCPDVVDMTCEGGNPPWRIFDEDECCFYYECAHCVGPQGVIKNPGDIWMDNCNECECEAYYENDVLKVKISCFPMECPLVNSSACDKQSQTPLTTFTQQNRCCLKIECQCVPSNCKYETKPCPLGYEAVPTVVVGECCATIDCRPMDVCLVEGVMYQIGHAILVSKSSCETCTCSNVKDPKTGLNTVTCKPIQCAHCPEGFVYEKSEDCCGKCVQVACVVVASDGSSHLLKPDESQFPLNDNCTQYICERRGDTFITSSHTKVCPARDEEECTSDMLEKTPDGCCSICKANKLPQLPKTCSLQKILTLISVNGCSAKVTLSYCEGWCPSYRKFSEKSLQMEGSCQCCMETAIAVLDVILFCPSGKNTKIVVHYPASCACTVVNCKP